MQLWGDNGNSPNEGTVLPQYTDLLWPTLQALLALGGTAKIEEIEAAVVEREGLSGKALTLLHGEGPTTEFEYRVGWSRTYLKGMKLIANTSRGVWSVTEVGRRVKEVEIKPLLAAYTAEKRRKRTGHSRAESRVVSLVPAPEYHDSWRESALTAIADLSAKGFENFSHAVVYSSGFTSIAILPATAFSASENPHVEGVGVLRVSLVSFSVFFRFLRTPHVAGADVVREFRASMAGRGEKGMLVSTGSFNSDAKFEAHRQGAPPIALIDGAELCDILKEHGLGVRITARTIEDVSIVPEFFEDLAAP